MQFDTDEYFVKSYEGHFFDFTLKSGAPLFTDYHMLNKEISLLEDGSGIKLGGKKYRKSISSIDGLKKTLDELVNAIISIFHTDSMFDVVGASLNCDGAEESWSSPLLQRFSFHLDFSNLKTELLVEQLVFDMLFDKYLNDSEAMFLLEYSGRISHVLYTDKALRVASKDAIYRNLKRGIDDNYTMMKLSERLREDLVQLGVDLEKYDVYFNPKAEDYAKKKPKYVWDYFYYNRNMITYRQYRRALKRDGRNYPYEELISDLNDYDDFVDKMLPLDNESPKKYFNMSMDYYLLESYKRIDFIGKLVCNMSKIGLTELDREHFLVKRFHPCVSIPCEKGNELQFAWKHKYYRPFLILEDVLHKEMQDNRQHDHSIYADVLLKHHIIRAKVYELFKYHYEFISEDYGDIKNFICQSYNMVSYHDSNEVLKRLKGKSWGSLDDKARRETKLLLQKFTSLNSAFFWESDKRKPIAPNI